MKKKLKLKPCPFCGSDKIEDRSFGATGAHGSLSHRMCSKCGSGGPLAYVYMDTNDIDNLWNSRMAESAIERVLKLAVKLEQETKGDLEFNDYGQGRYDAYCEILKALEGEEDE